MRTEILPDGTVKTVYSPSRAMVAAYPSYGEWKDLLASRPTHATVVDGEVKLTCICCGTLCQPLNMSTIWIGGLVRLQQEEQVGGSAIDIRTVLRPITIKGLGCPACVDRYAAAVIKVGTENQRRAKVATLDAEIADLRSKLAHAKGEKVKGLFKVESPTERVAWIDMFEDGWRHATTD